MLKNKLKKIFSKTMKKPPFQVFHQYYAIQEQWDPVENIQPFPDDPVKNKDVVGRWKCEKGHFWYETIENRAHYRICHACHTPGRVTENYNLEYLRPDIIKEWHPTKNKGITPDEVTPYSKKMVWWICNRNHEWQATISTRSNQHGCPECTNKRVGKDNNLAVLNPNLSNEWHPIKNGELTPWDVTLGSHKKVWWICNKGHNWKTEIRARVYKSNNCPVCSNRIICKKNRKVILPSNSPTIKVDSFQLIQEWHPKRNGIFSLYNVSHKSNKKAWWKCNRGHEWKATIAARASGNNCPECANQRVGKDNNLAVLRPDLAKEWNHEENGDFSPYDAIPGSSKKVSWKCEKGHKWKAIICDRVRKSRCPECTNKKVGKDNNLAALRLDLKEQWHQEKNNLLTPYDVTPGSAKKAWWKCEKGHEWEANIVSRAKGRGCPECTNQRVGKDNNLAVLRPDLALEWSYTLNKELTPDGVTPGSHKKVWWKCEKGHEWQAKITNRSKGRNCPFCYLKKFNILN